MIPTLFKRTLMACKLALASSLVAIGISGCGGGGSGSGSENVVAPESMDQVKINFFNAFTMQCSRLSGTAGNETGGVAYTQSRSSFRWQVPTESGNGGLGRTIDLPLVLGDVKYVYERTGYNTGRLTFSFNNNQVYAPPLLGGDMFWGGDEDLAAADNLIVDVLFADVNGYLSNSSARIRNIYLVKSEDQTVDGVTKRVVLSISPIVADSTELTFSLLTGGTLPTHYNPYSTITAETPASAVWTTFQGRTVEFYATGGGHRKVSFQSVGGVGSPIPGKKIAEESGTILVDSSTENDIKGVEGTYSYLRTGGDKALFSITYGTTQVVYNMDFDTLVSGTYTEDGTGIVGSFIENLYAPQP